MRTVEYYSAIKKNEIMPFTATWMDLEMIMLSDIYIYILIKWVHVALYANLLF